ncbi:F-box protein CPR1-like [Malus domestica]|uniref:F-box protein CPR1-like n=1 Tax=Malus domestica TaxID=3750 RepID=UPI003974D9C9
MKMGQDMLVKILLTLPPKTLMRFKCVSKWWFALINNPGFVSKHLSNSANNNLTTIHVFLARLVVQRQHEEEEEEENPKCNSTTKKEETQELLSILGFCKDDDNTDDEHSNSCSLVGVQDIIIPQSFIQKIGVPEQPFGILGHCNGIVLLSSDSSLVLCNPGIGEFNRIPDEPCLPMWPLDQPDDHDGQEHMETGFHIGFGYDPVSNECKVVTFTNYFEEVDEDCRRFLSRHKAVVYTTGCDFWEELNTDSLETETTLFWPEYFQMPFKGMCYWLGYEQDKELFPFDAVEHRFRANGGLIISFDTSREVFHGIPFPSELQPLNRSNHLYMKLTVWNESVAFFALGVNDRRYPEPYEMWVMDDDFKGAWTKHFTIEGTDDQIRRSSPVALWGDECLMVDNDGHVVFFNLCTKKLKHTPIETVDNNIVVYVNSIVSVMGRSHKLKSIENTCSDKDEDAMVAVDGKRESCRRLYSYSVWAIPPADVSRRIKKLMESLEAEFGGPEIEPHIPILGSIQMMSREDALNKFRFAPMDDIVAKVDRVITKNYYYQCVSLLMDRKLFENAQRWSYHFGFYNSSMPYLSLLYGKLTEEERKKAGEIVNILDESITGLTFPITHFALYEIDNDDRSLKSWTKIAEIGR